MIDWPSFHEDSENDDNIKELCNVTSSARNGVYAIALVVNKSQSTSSHMTLLLELLGDLWPFVFIIFSEAKRYGDTDEEQRKRINKTYDSLECPSFKKLLDKVERRFIMLECTETSQKYRTSKLTEFLGMVDYIYHTNERNKINPAEEQRAEIADQEELQHASEESEKGQKIMEWKEIVAEPVCFDCGSSWR